MSEKKITDEEIQKALSVLNQIGAEDTDIEKSNPDDIDNDEDGKKADEKAKEAIEKSEKVEDKSPVLADLIKSMHDDFSSKVQSLAHINQYLVQENEELKKSNEDILKSLTEQTGLLNKVLEATNEMANSPLNRLGNTIKKSVQIEKFDNQNGSEGKRTISLTQNKREVLGMLEKSLDTEEGQKRLGQVVGLIENGFVDQENFNFLQKSVQNEIGGDFNIVY